MESDTEMKLLIMGGTRFLGRQFVEAALRGGHEVTLFHRGQTGADLFPKAEHILGDRNGPMDTLRGRRWDAVVDTSAYFPDSLKASAKLLAGSVERYVFVSSISVYPEAPTIGMTEDSPLAQLTAEQLEQVYERRRQGATGAAALGEAYGGLKALCEAEVEAALPGRALIVRPGLIVGPHDSTDRFTYWVRRVARGGEVLAPADPQRGQQFIDARDLAEWMLRMTLEKRAGIYQATGPKNPLPMGAFLEACREASGSDAHFTWVKEDFLLEQKVGPWVEMPLWMPDGPGERGFMAMDCSRALGAGLSYRPVLDIVRDTLDWDRTRGDSPMAAGLKMEREQQLLAAWHAR